MTDQYETDPANLDALIAAGLHHQRLHDADPLIQLCYRADLDLTNMVGKRDTIAWALNEHQTWGVISTALGVPRETCRRLYGKEDEMWEAFVLGEIEKRRIALDMTNQLIASRGHDPREWG